jgi:hypothetical protein
LVERIALSAKRWLAFLRNHREAIAAMDFFTVPTITFGVLYWHPTSLWVVQQLREVFPFGSAPRFVVFDRDSKYVWGGGPRRDPIDENQMCAHFVAESLAEWNCGALG